MRFKQTDANGNTMTYGYDDQNRRIITTNAAGEWILGVNAPLLTK
jgi:YD repeat-containing protein